MSDLTQQALTALADAGLGNESAAEAFVVGYQAGCVLEEPSSAGLDLLVRGLVRVEFVFDADGQVERLVPAGLVADDERFGG